MTQGYIVCAEAPGDGLLDWIIFVARPFSCLSHEKRITCCQTKQTDKTKLELLNRINSLRRNSLFLYHVVGIEVKYSPKEGQCEAICCNGAGGELTVEPVCTPVEKCEGISKDEKKESGHCPGESIGSCPDTCKGELYMFVCLLRYRVTVGV